MNVLILGSGGREHTFAWKIAQSTKCGNLFVAPGNAGTHQVATNVAIDPANFEEIGKFIQSEDIHMLVVGPEAPLVAGIRDYFENEEGYQSLMIVGPGKKGAKLEGSKDFSKAFMQRHNIPTAKYATFTLENFEEGTAYIQQHPLPIVIKADGLAAGKGVVIAESHQEAQTCFNDMIKNLKFGEASAKVVIEEFLEGIELSVFVLTDGDGYVILPEAKDYKRIGEGDTGLNTGGMGAVSPVPFVDGAFMELVDERIIQPTVDGLKKDDIPYQGFIFIGLMNVNGDPYVIEYNVRMGDPETEVVLPRIKNDFLDLLESSCTGHLGKVNINVTEEFATTAILVAGGYPEVYEKGNVITHLDGIKNGIIFHAGTIQKDSEIVTNGGRVIACTSMGKTMEDALEGTFEAAEQIQWNNKYYRKDIGKDLVQYMQ